MRLKDPVEIAIESVIEQVTKLYMERGEAFGCFIRKKNGDMTATLTLEDDEDGYWMLEVVDGKGGLLVYYQFQEEWCDDGGEMSVSLQGIPCAKNGVDAPHEMYDEDDDECPTLSEWEWLEDLIDAGEIAAQQLAKLEGKSTP